MAIQSHAVHCLRTSPRTISQVLQDLRMHPLNYQVRAAQQEQASFWRDNEWPRGLGWTTFVTVSALSLATEGKDVYIMTPLHHQAQRVRGLVRERACTLGIIDDNKKKQYFATIHVVPNLSCIPRNAQHVLFDTQGTHWSMRDLA